MERMKQDLEKVKLDMLRLQFNADLASERKN